MNATKVNSKLAELEAMAELFKNSVATLKEELQGSGAPKGSARKGGLPESEKARILAKRQKNRIKKPR